MQERSGWQNTIVSEHYASKVEAEQNSDNYVSKRFYHDPIFLSLINGSGVGRSVGLDLGCGDMYLANEVRRAIPQSEIIGMDFPTMIGQRVSELGPQVYPVAADATRIPLSNESVDFVYSSLLLHWVENHDVVLSEVYRVLKPSGSFIGSTVHPNYFKRGVSVSDDGGETYHFQPNNLTQPDVMSVMLSENIGPINYFRRPAESYLEALQKNGFINCAAQAPTTQVLEGDLWHSVLRKHVTHPRFLFMMGTKHS